jgi:hypothetical protein
MMKTLYSGVIKIYIYQSFLMSESSINELSTFNGNKSILLHVTNVTRDTFSTSMT